LSLVGNNAVNHVDRLGLSEFAWTGVHEEFVDNPNAGGFATLSMRPEAEIQNEGSGCCWHVRVTGGSAGAHIVWTKGNPEGVTPHIDTLEHERYHVRHHLKPAYEDYKTEAMLLGQECMGRPRAECIRRVILNELKVEYNSRSDRDATEYDWSLYGQQSTPNVQLNRLTAMLSAQSDYYRALSASTAALAACPPAWQK
jgi:hypothetical protein